MENVNPYSTEVRYMLDFMGYLMGAQRPRSVRIRSDSVEMVRAAVRRLSVNGCHLFVDTPELQADVQASLGLEVNVAGSEPADAALLPLTPYGTSLLRERIIVGAVHNALSYKSLLYPGGVRTTAISAIRRVKRHYHIGQVVGMYSPAFIALLAWAHLLGRGNPADYFRLTDRAMQYLYEYGPMWRLSYVVIFTGSR